VKGLTLFDVAEPPKLQALLSKICPNVHRRARLLKKFAAGVEIPSP
jgi:hypothetical protein